MNNGKPHTGWRMIPLCEAAKVTMGSSPPGESYNDEGKGVPLINGPVEFSEGDFGLTIRGKSTTEPTRMCRTGDLLLCVRGSTTGRTNIAGFEACIGRGVASIRANEDQRFLNHFIRTQRQRLFDLGNGSTFPSITQEQLTSVKVPLPPLPEQRRLAAILDTADAIRTKREEGIRLTEEMLRCTFLEMFGDPATNPKGWEMRAISNLTDVKTGATPSRDIEENFGGNIPWVKTSEVVGSTILDTNEKLTEIGFQSARGELYPVGSILVALYGQGATRGRTGLLGIPATTNQACAVILPSPHISKDFLWAVLKLSYDRLRDQGRGGNQPNLNLGMIRGFMVQVPPKLLQEKFEQIASTISNLAVGRTNAATESHNLFDSLVQRVFRGEL